MALTQVPPALLTSTTGTGNTVVLSTAPTISGDLTVTGTMVMGSSFMRNRIINGAMVIDQRNAGASLTPANQYTLDRWTIFNSQSSKLTVQQNAGSVTPPAGFTNYLGVTSSSAYTVLAGDYFILSQMIEGYNMADLDWGTANAKTVTLSFWVRSSLTGNFGASVRNSAGNRSYPVSYTISSANTWEYKTITITGDITGTWQKTNSTGIELSFSLGIGSTYSGTANTWSSSNFVQPTGSTSVVGTNGATFYITGVQLEIGTSATPFERRLYNQELANCQRYYQEWGGNSGNERLANTFHYSTTQSRGDIPLIVTMRSTPTLTVSSASHWAVESATGIAACTSITLDQASAKIAATNFNVASGLTAGQGAHIMANSTTSARFNLSSEL